jgi:glycosyltransferase involved in cell wall biosynthesis
MSDRPRVLIVTYHYPPTSAVGALRAEKFVKYLPEFGWDPVVLTVRNDAVSTSTQTGPVPIIRTNVWRGPVTAYLAAKRAFRGRSGKRADSRSFEHEDTIDPTPTGTIRRIVLSLTHSPDGEAGWWGPAVLAGRRLMRGTRCTALFTTAPPLTTHLIGLALRRPGVRWVADFRDPWVDNPSRPRSMRSALSDALDRRGERAVVSRSDAVTTTTERLRAQLVGRYPGAAARLHTIPNGVDHGDFEGVPRRPDAKFSIAHVGNIYYRRSPEPLFAAVRSLLDVGALPSDATSLVFAGEIADFVDLPAMARRHGVADLLDMRGLLPRRRALEVMASAGALLLLAQDQPLQIPAKTFEYMAAGPPIIALTGPGATADLIRESHAGVAVAPDDTETLRGAILDAYVDWKRRLTDGASSRRSLDARFDRRQLTAQLAALLSTKA